jgi:hypothetical protein
MADVAIIGDVIGQGIASLAGGLMGGLFRLAPEFLKLFTSKRDQDHEFRMQKLAGDQAKDGSEQRIRETEMAGQNTLDAKGLDALVAAITSQGQKTGFKLADSLSAMVRPVVTYWWLALYTAVKVSLICAAWDTLGGAGSVSAVWGVEDSGMLFGIMNFWFLDRVIKKRAG